MLAPILTVVDGKEIDVNQLSEKVINAAIKVHTELGPGLLESLHEKCLFYELEKRGLEVQKQVPVEAYYDGILMDVGFKIDLLVGKCPVIEVKEELLSNSR
jgi:GxxExxY protein